MTFTYGYNEMGDTPVSEHCVALFPDGSRVAAICYDGEIWIQSKDGVFTYVYEIVSYDSHEGLVLVDRQIRCERNPEPSNEEELPF